MKHAPSIPILCALLVLSACSQDPAGKNKIPPERRLKWRVTAAGVHRTEAFKPESYTLLKSAGIRQDEDGLRSLPGAKDDPPSVTARRADGKTMIRIPLERGESIYGLGLFFQTVDQRGRILRLHVDHYGGTDSGRNHAPVPFFVSSRGYGVLINTSRYVDLWIGTAVRLDSPNPPQVRDRNTDPNWTDRPESDCIEIVVSAPGVEMLYFEGPSMLDAVRRYVLYSGGGVLPPKWGLGFWQRVPTLFSDRDVYREIRDFEEHGFPLDVVGLEPGWQSRSYPCSYVWDRGRFPDPETFLNSLSSRGLKVNLWINPYVSPESPLHESLAPLSGTHTVWCGLVPDYSLQEVRNLTADHFEGQIQKGVGGYKIDEVDGFDVWLWPDAAVFPSGRTGETMRQTYGLLWQRMIMDIFRGKNLRTYGLVRGTNAGGSSFPYALYSDAYSHREFITALSNSGFCGLLFAPEARSASSAEEWLRRMQTSCFSPLAMINAWADGTKPWSFPEVFGEVRDAALLRIRLLPYLYTAFASYRFHGIPPFRSVVLEPGWQEIAEYPGAVSADRVRDQYMMGPDILVAPLFAGERERSVVFPPGDWYDFYTGRRAGQGIIRIRPKDLNIPLFVRNGAIIPMIQETERIGLLKAPIPLELRHYGNKPGSLAIYDDDGITWDYENGSCSWVQTRAVMKDGHWTGEMDAPANGHWSYGKVTWRFMSKGPEK